MNKTQLKRLQLRLDKENSTQVLRECKYLEEHGKYFKKEYKMLVFKEGRARMMFKRLRWEI